MKTEIKKFYDDIQYGIIVTVGICAEESLHWFNFKIYEVSTQGIETKEHIITTGFIKWDGCSEFNASKPVHEHPHFCGQENLEAWCEAYRRVPKLIAETWDREIENWNE